MAIAASPLRYPGGKTALLGLTAKILRINGLHYCEYAEPYAGGCGLALSLLFGGHVTDIHINDIDPAIWAFWHCVLNDTEEFLTIMHNTPVTMTTWHEQKKIHHENDLSTPLKLGFSAFFLNRTNRSGIIKGAGAIGGKHQLGNYKLDCRFNKEMLTRRIQRIASYKDRIHLYRMDAIKFLAKLGKILPEDTFFCIDPPYFNKGKSLYTNAYDPDDHKEVAAAVLKLNRPWIVTYDDTPEIRSHYIARRQYCFDINYSAQIKRVGTELLIAQKNLRLPKSITTRQVNRPKYKRLRTVDA